MDVAVVKSSIASDSELASVTLRFVQVSLFVLVVGSVLLTKAALATFVLDLRHAILAAALSCLARAASARAFLSLPARLLASPASASARFFAAARRRS